MNQIFGYPAVVWATRFLLLLVLVVAGWILLLACARYFRPKHIRAMLGADLPKVEELGAEFHGFKAKLRFNAQAAALNVLENRMDVIETAVGRLWTITEEHSQGLTGLSLEKEGGNVE
ncbi:MAG TPA: hypothetical protein VFJ82_15595 [Longimicrobium sp.]|nr:hypothetical protein [Longimicrobium sp.]